ncbi:MAG: radical SAM protein [Candidatus Nanoarchaeia archaeon]|jgi:MoaA/NifB/PqqE/SkfB family radical SAM enzyme
MKQVIMKVKRYSKFIYNMLRHQGLKATYNYTWFYLLWQSKFWSNLLLIKLGRFFNITPPFMEIEVTTKCNLKCKICEHTYWSEPARDMNFEEFKRIIDQFPHLKWIGLTGIGEAFLNKDYLKMIEYVKKKKIYVEIYDSFIFLNEKIARKLIELGVDRILASIDGATKETYEKIRVGSNFDVVTKNIKKLIELKKEMKKPFPEVNFHFIVNKINVKEVPLFMDYVNSIKMNDDVKVIYTLLLHPFKEIKNLVTKVPNTYFRQVKAKANSYGIRMHYGANVPDDKEPMDKCIEWIMPFVFVTGHVIPCCVGNEANQRDFQKKTSLGNIKELSLKEIWFGKDYKELREGLRKGKVPAPCANCSIYKKTVRKK